MRRFHVAYCAGQLEIGGNTTMTGPQQETSIPPEVLALFDSNPLIQRVTVERERSDKQGFVAQVYTRMEG